MRQKSLKSRLNYKKSYLILKFPKKGKLFRSADSKKFYYSLGFQVECDRDTELSCDDGLMCYPINKKCDRWSDCIMDRSDESQCSCRDYLESNRICDGYPDCPDGQDESGCFCANKHNCGFTNRGNYVIIF